MRIAILTNSFPPDGHGGAERIASMQADGFGVRGHEVKVWAARKAPRLRSVQAPSGKRSDSVENSVHGIEVERFPSEFGRLSEMSIVRRLAFHLFEDVKMRRDVADRIVAWKPDVLLTHNLTGCGLGTARSIQSRGVRWIHTLHDIQLTDPSGQETVAWSKTVVAGTWRRFWSAWRRGAFGQPDVVVSPTQWLLEWHAQHGFLGRGARSAPRDAEARSSGRTPCAPTGTIIPNPVTMTALRERQLRHPVTIAYVGRLSADKGFDVFLDALTHLDASVVGRAIVVGDGPMSGAAGDARLVMRGRLSADDARRVIADADLLIAPSRILENQQTIIVEAMAEGTPVVATDTGGTKETLEGTECQVSTDANAQKIADAIRDVLADESRWSRTSRAMQERAKRHDVEQYFEKLIVEVSLTRVS